MSLISNHSKESNQARHERYLNNITYVGPSPKNQRVGLILAGGNNQRLRPCSLPISKSLLPIYNKPLIYYSLSILLLAKIRDILIISTPKDIPRFQDLFGDGSQLGLNIQYKEQVAPNGIAESFILGEEFINKRPCTLILGDNLFYFHDLVKYLKRANSNNGATLFGYEVSNPQDYGVAEFKNGKIINIEEKPRKPASNIAITGLYFYDKNVCEYAKNLKPSYRNELEITDLNNIYLQKDLLNIEILGRGCVWLDTGQPNQLLQAGNFVQMVEERMGLKIGAIEEICLQNKWIDKHKLSNIIDKLGKNEYAGYLEGLIDK